MLTEMGVCSSRKSYSHLHEGINLKLDSAHLARTFLTAMFYIKINNNNNNKALWSSFCFYGSALVWIVTTTAVIYSCRSPQCKQVSHKKGMTFLSY